MKLIPTNNRVLVKVDSRATTTDAGLHLPAAAAGKPLPTGFVTAAGPNSSIPIGTRVYFNIHAGEVVSLDENDKTVYRLMDDDDILATLE